MKFFIVLCLFLVSCSSTRLLKIAVKKNPNILVERVVFDTLNIVRLDSVLVDCKDSFYWEKVIFRFDTVIELRYKFINRFIDRKEFVLIKDSLQIKRMEIRYKKLLLRKKYGFNLGFNFKKYYFIIVIVLGFVLYRFFSRLF